MDVIKEKWEEIIQKLKVEYFLSNISFETWIRPLEVYEIRGNTLYLTVNFKASIEHIQNKYLLPLKVCIAEVTGTEYQIKFIPRDLPREQQRRYLEKTAPVKEKTHKHKEVSPIAEKANLNPKYTFDTFVVGGNNNFAHAASLAVAESPGEVYNPLFLYGGVGLGKTHLMHSIAHYILDREPPKDMTTLEARLRTRFEWGLIADISVPDYETRMAILYKKIELDQLERYQIPDEVIQYIAMNIKTNIRELEGSLNKLIALYRIGGRKSFDVSLAAEALRDMIAPDESRKVTPELVLDVVSDHFNVSVSELKGSRRNARTAGARQIVMYLCRQMTDASLQRIGDLLGGRDHSTVNHGVDKIARDVEKDEALRNTIEIIQKKISPL